MFYVGKNYSNRLYFFPDSFMVGWGVLGSL